MTQRTRPDLEDLVETLDDFTVAIARMSPDPGLSRTAVSTLAALCRTGPMRLTVLADHESVSQPAMTGLIRRLETAGLVSRDADPSDGRAVVVAITTDGRTSYEQRRRAHTAVLQDALCSLEGPDRAALVDALPAIRLLTSHVSAHKEKQ